MRLKLTVMLMIILMGLLLYIFYIDPWGNPSPEVVENRNPFGEAAADIEYISFRNPTTNATTTLEKQGKQWMLTSPFLWPANEFAVNRILTQIRFLDKKISFRVDSLNIAETSLAEYGLDPAQLLLEFGKGDIKESIEIGKVTDIGDNLYILSSDKEYIHVVDRSLRDNILMTQSELRDNRIFLSGIFEVTSWNLAIKNGTDQQMSSSRTRLSKTDDQWNFETPIRARADSPAVNTTLNQILNLQTAEVLTDSTPSPEFGLQSPDYRIAIESESSREVLDIGSAIKEGPNQGLRYAKLEKRPTLFLIDLDFEDIIANAQTKLRDRHIFDLDMTATTSVTIQRGENDPLTLQRLENNEWEILIRDENQGIASSKGDKQAIEATLESLSNLVAVPDSGFLNDAPSAANIEGYGLKTPRYKISVTSPKLIGKEIPLAVPKTETLLIGNRNPEHNIERSVKIDQKESVYSVYDDTLTNLNDNPILFQDRTIYQLPASSKITHYTIEKLSDQTILVDTSNPDFTSEEISTFTKELQNIRAQSYLSNTLLSSVSLGNRMRPWAYKLTVYVPNGGDAPAVALQLLISELTGGPLLIGGSVNSNKTFRFEQSFIDTFTPLVFDRVRVPTPKQVFAPASPQKNETIPPNEHHK